MLIIRRAKLHYIASGIIKPIGGRLVHIRRSKLHYTVSGIITPIGVMIPEPLKGTAGRLLDSFRVICFLYFIGGFSPFV